MASSQKPPPDYIVKEKEVIVGEDVDEPDDMSILLPPSTSYDKSNIFSRLFNTWLNPLLSKGHVKTLNHDDLEPVPRRYRARYNWVSFKDHLDDSLIKQEPLWRPLWKTFGRDFLLAGLLRFIGDVSGTAAPKILNYLLALIERKESMGVLSISQSHLGYWLCVSLFLLYQVNSLAINGYFQMTMQLGFKCRVSLMQALYRHSLTLGPHQRIDYNSGKMTNLVANDTQRVERSVMFLHYVWGGPLQIIMIMAYLWTLLGWVSLIGLLVFCMCYPIQNALVSRMTKAKNASLTLTDARVKKMQEIVEGMRIIKFNAWEDEFLRQLERLRAAELHKILNVCIYRCFITFLTTMGPVMSCVSTFLTYYIVKGRLPIRLILPAIAYFNALRLPLALLPLIISMVSDAVVALRRMQQCLKTETSSYRPVPCQDPQNAIESDDAVLTYYPRIEDGLDASSSQTDLTQGTIDNRSTSSEPLKLGSFAVKRGELVAVIGPTGSGKSSFLNALIGELTLQHGQLRVSPFPNSSDSNGKSKQGIAYCPQTAWVRNCSVRDNILQGLPFDFTRYQEVIEACQLKRDLELLPNGDDTLIGDRGANLSGGQKHRVSMARAAYYNQTDLFLADDPLAALDANVRKRVWRQLFCSHLHGKTRIVCTHDEWLLPTVDRIMVFHNQQIIFNGTYQDYIKTRPLSAVATDIMSRPSESLEETTPPLLTATTTVKKESSTAPKPKQEEEDRATGKVSRNVYWMYFAYCGGWLFVLFAMSCTGLHQLTRIGDSYWIINWDARHLKSDTFSMFFGNMGDMAYFAVYVLWGLGQGFFSLLGALVFTSGGLRSARIHHQLAAKGVVYAPISFVERNPSGRILNRFSRDIDSLDNDLPEDLRSFLSTLGFVLAGFALIVAASWVSFVFLVPLAIVSYFIQRYFRCSLRELKRVESVSRSPLFSNLTETYDGLTSIRAFGYQPFFIRRHERAIDDVDAVTFVLQCMQRWIALRLESIGNVAVLIAATFVFGLAQHDSGVAGVALVYSLTISGALNWSLRQFAEAESRIISSERLLHYGAQLPSEEFKMSTNPSALKTNDKGSNSLRNWPSKGEIVAQDVNLRYADPGPYALKHLSFHIKPKEKVGVVGRTGAGKSSLIAALYRLYEYDDTSSILIDGIECKTVGLKDLRRALTIIPQDPIVFSGTLRSNLDPLGMFPDERLWNALYLAHLRDALQGRNLSLDSQLGVDVTLSAGQRQLLCLARALLHKTPIVVLDEATACIDPTTDTLVQECLHREFADCTVITIAHRLATIMNYDRVFVFDGGCIVEQGSPTALLQDSTTRFHKLGQEMGLV